MNRKRKFAQSAAPAELKLHDFILKKKDKRMSAAVNLKLGKTVNIIYSLSIYFSFDITRKDIFCLGFYFR